MEVIDFRSDTLTKPTPDMRAAMASAEVGDDVYGEDPTINALEQRVAAMLGKPAALLCTSGTQSNLLGILSHCQRGEEYIVGAPYHTYKYEAGGAAVLGGVVPHTVSLEADGSVAAATLRGAVKADDPHFPISRLIALENTHLGRVISQAQMWQAREVADEFGLRLHLDGARLANASVATGLSLAELAQPFDSVSLCCSKGLGAPVGSLLIGSEELIGRARRWRKMLGGGMRQAGVIAAAIDYALTHHMARLADDHTHAEGLSQQLGTRLASLAEHVQVAPAHTNMVYLNFADPQVAQQVSTAAREAGILVPASAAMRLVTHLDITSQMIEKTVDILTKVITETVQAR
ncbi:L-threonine aldolase [Aliidiomarina maris]|uniref:L-threonine aldolase n=1 Tax=Aliidiomarina maris TaxID=531312 RepID=A0A327WZ15_9GAMM|nr:L-threonine aldolase [Aliidiomarina maris]